MRSSRDELLEVLERRLKQEVLVDPNAALDYELVSRIVVEHAKKSGKITTRGTQTSEKLTVKSLMEDMSKEKFKKFFYAVFYTYMMMTDS